MKALLFIFLTGLYISLFLQYVWFQPTSPSWPIVRETAPMSVSLRMYSGFVPFGVFAILTIAALWKGVDLPRHMISILAFPPILFGVLSYTAWWVG